MSAPLGLARATIDPPNFTASPSYTDLLNETLGDTAAAFAQMDAAIAALQAESMSLETDVATMDADLAAMDAVIGVLDIGLPDQGDLPPVDPGLDIPGADSFVSDTSTALLGNAAALTPLASVPIVTPDGNQAIVIGTTPAQGGAAHAGDSPYVLQVECIGFAILGTNLKFDSLTGDNPPFDSFVGFTQKSAPSGVVQNYVALQINPVNPGTFIATLKYEADFNQSGIAGHTTISQAIVVLILPPPPPPPPPVIKPPIVAGKGQ